jgi:integrin beta 3
VTASKEAVIVRPDESEVFADLVVQAIETALGPVLERLAAAEVQMDRVVQLDATVADLGKAAAALCERAAVLETRAPVAGPPGPPGRDGVDGVGFDGLGVEQRDDRSFTITASRADCVKEIGTARFAADIYRGIWTEGRTYEPGDGVTWSGSEWHCHTPTTTKPGDGSKAWTLKVKRGRDGKDGKDGPPGPPGAPGRDWEQVYDDKRRR